VRVQFLLQSQFGGLLFTEAESENAQDAIYLKKFLDFPSTFFKAIFGHFKVRRSASIGIKWITGVFFGCAEALGVCLRFFIDILTLISLRRDPHKLDCF